MIKIKKIRAHEKGLYFCNGEFVKRLNKGWHFFLNPLGEKRIDVVNERSGWFSHKDLDMIIKSGLVKEEITVVDLKDKERALVWIDNRFETILTPGQYALWNTYRDIKVEVVTVEDIRFVHESLDTILKNKSSANFLNEFVVEEGFEGLFFKNGDFVETLKPGRYAFWKDAAKVKLYNRDLRGQVLDVSGQEIMTADKVTLRLNGLVNYRIEDSYKSITEVDDSGQALYREAQLILREVIGTRELGVLLEDKNTVLKELTESLSVKARAFGVSVTGFGIKDIILPGDMKDLLNKVIEAKKVSEANLISRREEVAAMRSQANTARILADNPTLMKLKELDVLEKVAQSSKLNVLLGEKGLSERVSNLI